MNAVRSFLFVIWLYGGMAVIGITCLPTLLLPRKFAVAAIRFYAQYVRMGLRLLCGIKVELRGREHIPQGPVLIAGKHQAMLDVFIPFILFSDPAIILKRELLWYPALGWYALKTKMIPIDRAGTSKTLKMMLREAKARTEEGRQVLIYPEGTRQPAGAAPDYKSAGVTALYNQLEVPVVPLATNSGLCWKPRGMVRKPGLVVYEALPPIPAALNRKDMFARLKLELEAASDKLLDEGLAAQGRKRADLAVG
ncbi:lysophospholipid acyltransferase family protein [Henriciella marina]|uniref:Lysophospholipid acyltransferase family protein n=1 Tax=Henriciella marina TaxID=453851 RepID=A0ABT4LRK1_9PROT|nr:lysophospholipid acyltransferase family protein [Henriciella marina]MCZ4296941.1 lysophospholipid acyltransferase family protein [Henriciella marina]